MLDKTLSKLYDIERDETVIKNRSDSQYTKLELLYNEGEPKVTIVHGYSGNNNERTCFFIN
jgi:hypothetical protein